MVKCWIYSVLLVTLLATGCNDAGRPSAENASPPPPSADNGNASPPAVTEETDHPIAVDDASFSSTVLASSQPVLVDFWAPWCGPCNQLTPTIEQIAAEYKGRVKVVKVNVDEAPDTAAKYNVTAIPMLVFLQDGELVESVTGVQSKGRLTRTLDQMLAD